MNQIASLVDYALMFFRLLLLAAAMISAACGITSRHVVGPTIDSNGHVGLLVSASLGPVLGCARKVAVPVRAAAGVAAERGLPGTDYDGAFALDLGVGVDWLFATPGGDRGYKPLSDSIKEPAAPSELSSEARSQLGKRLGLRTGLLHVGSVDAWSLGASGTLTIPLPRNLFALGVEGGCDVLLLKSGDDAPVFRCDLGVVFDVTNLHAFESDHYY